jgi:hypothetical protein
MVRLAALMPVALGASLVACVDTGDEGIYVRSNTAVGTSCSLSGSPDQASIGHGVINVFSTVPYVMTPLIQSRLIASETTTDDISKTVQLRGADVRLTLKAVSIERDGQFVNTNPEKAYPGFSVLFSGAIPPGGSANAFVDIIPPSILRTIAADSGANLDTDSLNAEVLAEVVIKGDLNGDAIESQPYFYPVTVCNDCVINVVGACPMTGTPRTGNACNLFQDGVVDCCQELDGGITCPARTGM